MVGLHFDESEPFASTGLRILDDRRIPDLAGMCENVAQYVVGRVIRQICNEEFGHSFLGNSFEADGVHDRQ